LFLFDVREACTPHLLGSGIETFATFGIHRKKAECLRERYTISSGMQKFNLRVHFSKKLYSKSLRRAFPREWAL
jgi:hypothetical protein